MHQNNRIWIGTFCLLLASCSENEKPQGPAYPDTIFENLPSAETGTIADMQGDWQSDDDAKMQISVTGSEFRTVRDGQVQNRGPFVFVKDCKSGEPDPQGTAFVVMESEDRPCYIMSAVTEDTLSYIHSKRGRVSRFTRQTDE